MENAGGMTMESRNTNLFYPGVVVVQASGSDAGVLERGKGLKLVSAC